jgi:DNA polymerase III subunit delta
MIIYLYGADTFRSRQYLKKTIAKFKQERDPQGYNVVLVDGTKEAASKIMAEIQSAPFLAERRMIVVENILSSKDIEVITGIAEKIKAEKFSSSNVVVFWQGEKLGKTKEIKTLDKLLQKEKYAQQFGELKGAQLVGWIEAEVKERAGKITRTAASYLAEQASSDSWRLSSIIDQLVAYAWRRADVNGVTQKDRNEIQIADVKMFVEEKLDDNIFSMVDAIAQGNRKQAFKLLQYQREQGEDDGKIFGLLVWQFRIMLVMGDLLEREDGLTSDQLAKKLKIHPFVAKKNLGVVKRQPLAKLQQYYQELLDMDKQTKTGAAPQPLLIDLFVGQV